MNSTRKKDVQYGKVDLLEVDEFDSQHGKERISLLIDLQVVEAFKKKAEQEGKKYQVMMREALRNAIFFDPVADLDKRLQRVESAVFKKRA